MKKVLAFTLLITYLVFTSGVVINYHYCMDRLASTQLFGRNDNTCNICGMESDDTGCCHDESIVLKSDEDQVTPASISFQFRAPLEAMHFFPDYLFLPIQNSGEWRFARTHPPPLLTEQDTYLQNRVFRI
jgi:hypothetical protein